MLSVPDQIIRNGLRLHAETECQLADALRMATNPYIFSGHPLFAGWRNTVAMHGHQDWIVDHCFRWVFESSGWPCSSFARAVARALRTETSPAAAVSKALLERDHRATERRVLSRWCALSRFLYRPEEVLPYLPPLKYVSSDVTALQGLARWVHSQVEYTPDMTKWGQPDFWQSPATTLALGSGDCEDSAILVWSAAALLGLPQGRLVVGTQGQEGHAWVEFPELNLFVESTNGTVGSMSSAGFLAFYRPWLFAYAGGRCDLASRLSPVRLPIARRSVSVSSDLC